MEKIRVGVIGCGSIAEVAHLPSIKKNPETELTAVCDINPETAKKTAEKWKVKRYFQNYIDMLEKIQFDAIVVASPNSFHHEHALAAAQAGAHLLVEKPLGISNKQAWEIVEASSKAKKKIMVGCDRRFWLQNEYAKQLISDGVIGIPVMGFAYQCQHYFYYQNMLAKTDFRLKPELAGAAAILDLGAHAIDLIIWLMGSEARRVMGIAKRLTIPENYTLLDDTAWIMIEHKNGALTSVACNRFSPVVSQATGVFSKDGTIMTSSDSTNPFQMAPLAVYTDKNFNINELPEIIKDYRYPQAWWAEDIVRENVSKRWVSIYPPRKSNYERMWRNFIECILEDKEPRVTGVDGAKALEVIVGTFKSMETGSWVDLPLNEEVFPPHYSSYLKNKK